MKKKLLLLSLIMVLFLGVTGCDKTRESALLFKEEYESVNGKALRDDITSVDILKQCIEMFL